MRFLVFSLIHQPKKRIPSRLLLGNGGFAFLDKLGAHH